MNYIYYFVHIRYVEIWWWNGSKFVYFFNFSFHTKISLLVCFFSYLVSFVRFKYTHTHMNELICSRIFVLFFLFVKKFFKSTFFCHVLYFINLVADVFVEIHTILVVYYEWIKTEFIIQKWVIFFFFGFICMNCFSVIHHYFL